MQTSNTMRVYWLGIFLLLLGIIPFLYMATEPFGITSPTFAVFDFLIIVGNVSGVIFILISCILAFARKETVKIFGALSVTSTVVAVASVVINRLNASDILFVAGDDGALYFVTIFVIVPMSILSALIFYGLYERTRRKRP